MNVFEFALLLVSSVRYEVMGFSWTERIWDKNRLSSKVYVRLVKKSWNPKDLIPSDKSLDEYPGTVEEAYKILRANTAGYEHIERPLEQAAELFKTSEYDKKLNSIIIIHPLIFDTDDVKFTGPTVTALAMRNIHRSNNIFTYNMPGLTKYMLFTIIRVIIGFHPKYEVVADLLTSFIRKGIADQDLSPTQINLVGYSYSANLSGYMARIVKTATNTPINSILCLDPFSMHYNFNLIHVSKDDAEVVHFLHSSSYTTGTLERVATADFVFNGGFVQPECVSLGQFLRKLKRFKFLEPFSCSHVRIVPRLWYIILFPSKFQARECDGWFKFQLCHCEDKKSSSISYPITSRDIHGTFYIRTSATKPYGLGDEGSHCILTRMRKINKRKKN